LKCVTNKSKERVTKIDLKNVTTIGTESLLGEQNSRWRVYSKWPKWGSFAIFEPRVFKFWILIEDYLSTNKTSYICDPLPNSSGIELGVEPSHIKVFFIILHHFLRNYINWYRRCIVNNKSFKDIFPIKLLVAHKLVAPILGFNYSQLQNEDKDSSAYVEVWEQFIWLNVIKKKIWAPPVC
jgi:hypothetical protein